MNEGEGGHSRQKGASTKDQCVWEHSEGETKCLRKSEGLVDCQLHRKQRSQRAADLGFLTGKLYSAMAGLHVGVLFFPGGHTSERTMTNICKTFPCGKLHHIMERTWDF